MSDEVLEEGRLHAAGSARSMIRVSGGLVNLVGLAKMLGVVKSTAHWHAQRPGFPEPVFYEGQAGPVKLWFTAEVDAWRKRGRR